MNGVDGVLIGAAGVLNGAGGAAGAPNGFGPSVEVGVWKCNIVLMYITNFNYTNSLLKNVYSILKI